MTDILDMASIKLFFVKEGYNVLIKISLQFVSRCPFNDIADWFRWCLAEQAPLPYNVYNYLHESIVIVERCTMECAENGVQLGTVLIQNAGLSVWGLPLYRLYLIFIIRTLYLKKTILIFKQIQPDLVLSWQIPFVGSGPFPLSAIQYIDIKFMHASGASHKFGDTGMWRYIWAYCCTLITLKYL